MNMQKSSSNRWTTEGLGGNVILKKVEIFAGYSFGLSGDFKVMESSFQILGAASEKL